VKKIATGLIAILLAACSSIGTNFDEKKVQNIHEGVTTKAGGKNFKRQSEVVLHYANQAEVDPDPLRRGFYLIYLKQLTS